MRRWRSYLFFASSLLVACGDGDLLPVTRDDQTRNSAAADPDHSRASDEESEPAPTDASIVHADEVDGGELEAKDSSSASHVDDASNAAQPDASPDRDGEPPAAPTLDASSASDAGMDASDAGALGDARVEDAQRPDTGTNLTYFRDAKIVIDAKCKPCHYQGGIGPFPLTKYSEVKPYAALMGYDIDAGVMPPWQASGAHGVFVGDRRLTDAQRRTLLTWIDQGALEGDPSTEPPAVPPDRRGLSRVDLSLPIGGPYTPQIYPDDYRCFVIEWPYTQTKYVTGVSIEPERTQSVHHAILYMEPPENAASVRAQDRNAAGPGFSCFSNSASLTTWMTSYEPGGYGQSIPAGLGFEVRPGSLMVLQIHYNSLNGAGPDNSRVDFEIADRVERVASVQQLLDASWVLGFMSIPANQADVVHRWRGRPSGLSSFFSYDLHWVDLHMHTLGSSGSVSIIRANAQREPLLQIPDWDFNWQQTYILSKSVKFNPGDQLEVECHFDNTVANQMIVNGERLAPRNVNWGEGTTDEMCLGNVLATRAP